MENKMKGLFMAMPPWLDHMTVYVLHFMSRFKMVLMNSIGLHNDDNCFCSWSFNFHTF